MNVFRKVLNAVAISFLIYFAIALGLIFSRSPVEFGGDAQDGTGLDFSRQTAASNALPATVTTYKARDGVALDLRDFPARTPNKPLLIFVHGSGWYGQQFDQVAAQFTPFAHVLAPDLRGHGPSTSQRGDVAYIGQMEDDLADLIKLHKKTGQKVIMAGHSSGGGLVARFAGGEHGALLDGAILLAPFLQYDAVTTRPNSGGWARPLLRRIIGLTMLNAANITTFNYLHVIQFNFPRAVLEGPLGVGATLSYSHRLNTGFSPRRDYFADIAALPRFLLIAGSDDESFIAQEYEPLMAAITSRGTYQIVPNVNHLDIVNADETRLATEAFLASFAVDSE